MFTAKYHNYLIIIYVCNKVWIIIEYLAIFDMFSLNFIFYQIHIEYLGIRLKLVIQNNLKLHAWMLDALILQRKWRAKCFTRRKEGDKSRRYMLPTWRCWTDCVMFYITQLDIHKTVSPAASGQQHVTTTFISLLLPSGGSLADKIMQTNCID